jgi:Type II secretion system (T2SS), protein N
MKRRTIVAFAVIVFIVAGIAFIPATMFERTINAKLGTIGSVRIEGGTIWSGRATAFIGTPSSRERPLDIPFTWSFAPSTLLQLRVGVDVVASGKALSGNVRLAGSFSNVRMTNADIVSSLELLERLNRSLAFVRPTGELRLQTGNNSVTVGYNAPFTANGALNAQIVDLRFRTFGAQSLGTHELTLTFAQQRIDYMIKKSGGIIAVGGGGNVNMVEPREFQFNGFTHVNQNGPAWLVSGARALGKQAADGRIDINFKTRF